MPDNTNYFKEAEGDALNTMENFIDEIIEQLGEKGKASDDLMNDYPNGDSYHHESHTDKSYTLLEAATLLDDLEEYEETDSGLWEGATGGPRQMVEIQAAYTYGNAVMSMWHNYMKELNEGFSADIELEPGSGSFVPKRRRSGPKEWSPRNKNLEIVTKYVKDFIEEKRR